MYIIISYNNYYIQFLIMMHCHWQKKSCFKFEFKGSCLKLQILDKDDVNGWMICPEVYPCEVGKHMHVV